MSNSGRSKHAYPIFVAVRIKPLGVKSGGGEVADDMKIGYNRTHVEGFKLSWDQKAGTVSRGPKEKYDFPTAIVAPEEDQASVFKTCRMDEMVDAFCDGSDINYIAFGQTGSGKTHTMFGPPKSMGKWNESGSSILKEHGLMPRIGARVLEVLKRKSGISYSLTGSMVELGMRGVVDLLGKRRQCRLDGGQSENDYDVVGNEHKDLRSMSDLRAFCASVENRLTRATDMNHSSSRTQCISILTLTTRDLETNKVTVSKFRLADLAGAERQKDANGSKNTWSHGQAMETIMVNYNLMLLQNIAQTVGKNIAKGKPPGTKVAFGCSTLAKMLSTSFTGKAWTGVMLCVSQAAKVTTVQTNKTTLTFGKNMSTIASPNCRQPSVSYETSVKEVKVGIKDCEKALSNKRLAEKWKVARTARLEWFQRRLQVLESVAPGAARPEERHNIQESRSNYRDPLRSRSASGDLSRRRTERTSRSRTDRLLELPSDRYPSKHTSSDYSSDSTEPRSNTRGRHQSKRSRIN